MIVLNYGGIQLKDPPCYGPFLETPTFLHKKTLLYGQTTLTMFYEIHCQ